MKITIKENDLGLITIDLKWKSRFAHEHKIRTIRDYPVGKREEEICKYILDTLKEAKSGGRLKF